MIKKLAPIFLLVILATPFKGIYSQVAEEPPPTPKTESQQYESVSVRPFAGAGQDIYYTHPEFNNTITRTVTTPAQNTEDGYLFIASPGMFNGGDSVLMILDDTGEPIYMDEPGNSFIADLRKQTVNGVDYLTYHEGYLPGGYTYGTSYVLDTGYQEVDSWTIDNGYGSDLHEFLLLDNGHAILMAYVHVPFDFTPYGGPANGTLIDIVLQEQDENKNVVFEWVASEHLPIEDTEANLNTTDPVDFLHTNAIEVDDDGNWLLSHRHFSEITKINRQTGDVMWRMGGVSNEFTFTNDIGFSRQHNIIRLDNGNITIFDNGNAHNPPHSRAIEYAIDEINKTVTRVWMYPDDTSEYSPAMGNHQRLPLGNSLIGWGTSPKITEVMNNGTVALEMLLGGLSYRAYRYPWSAAPAAAPRATARYDADPTAVTLYTSWNGATDITSYDVYAGPTAATVSLVGNAPHDGFETSIAVTNLPPDTCFFQTKPVHSQGNPTPFSNVAFRVDLPVCAAQLYHSFMPAVYIP